jgi:hypothetical protein
MRGKSRDEALHLRLRRRPLAQRARDRPCIRRARLRCEYPLEHVPHCRGAGLIRAEERALQRACERPQHVEVFRRQLRQRGLRARAQFTEREIPQRAVHLSRNYAGAQAA